MGIVLNIIDKICKRRSFASLAVVTIATLALCTAYVPESAATGEGEPIVKFFRTQYIDVLEAEALIKANGLLSPFGKTAANERTNTIMVKDFQANIADIERMLKVSDVKPRQVRIVVRYADTSDLEALGLTVVWNFIDRHWTVGNLIKRGTTDTGGTSQVEARAKLTRERITRHGTQNLLIQSGSEGQISTGLTVPHSEWFYDYSKQGGYYRGATAFRDVSTGFIVKPRVTDAAINVTITPELSFFSGANDSRLSRGEEETIRYRRLSTTVSLEHGVPTIIGGSSANPVVEHFISGSLGGGIFVNGSLGGKTIGASGGVSAGVSAEEETTHRNFYMVLTAWVEG